MPKRVAIVQSNYIPWKGYFDLIHAVDEFVLFDDVQYTRRDWRNRNRIKTAAGPLWLTIPVQVKGKYLQKVREVEVIEPGWASEHWKTIQHAYGRAAYFDSYRAVFEELYLGATERFLSEVNFRFLTALCGLLGIRTALTWSSQYELCEGRSERLLAHLPAGQRDGIPFGPGALEYLTGDGVCGGGHRFADRRLRRLPGASTALSSL